MRWTICDAPVEAGAGRPGCRLGPTALRRAGLLPRLREAGLDVVDLGSVTPHVARPPAHGNLALKALPEIVGWVEALSEAAFVASAAGRPMFLGGDHSLSAGTIHGLARRAAAMGKPLFVLWLDAHPDFHTLDTSRSGNLHGVPLAYVTGRDGFAGYFPPLAARLEPERLTMIGIRSIDADEREALRQSGATPYDVATLQRRGAPALLRPLLDRVAEEDGLLHVSLDVDFLDPGLAPAVGTTVPGGATRAEAEMVMDLLRDSGRVTSLDVVELNPLLDEDGRTARLMVDLVTRLLG